METYPIGYEAMRSTKPGCQELTAPGSCTIALHEAAKSQKRGSEIELAFPQFQDYGLNSVSSFFFTATPLIVT